MFKSLHDALTTTVVVVTPTLGVELWHGRLYVMVYYNPFRTRDLAALRPATWHSTPVRAYLPAAVNPEPIVRALGNQLRLVWDAIPPPRVLELCDPPWRNSGNFGISGAMLSFLLMIQGAAMCCLRNFGGGDRPIHMSWT